MNNAAWAAGVAAMVSCAGVSQGAELVHNFTSIGQGAVETPNADAIATLRYVEWSDMTRFNIVGYNLLPNQTYGVYVESDTGWAFSHAFAFTTNSWGIGFWHNEVMGDYNGEVTVLMYIWDPTIGFPGVPPEDRSWLDVTPEEWRAIGTSVE